MASWSLAILAAVFAVKLWLALVVPLFGDEAFYWMESRHPAPAYSDLPFMTALLVGAGTWLAGDGYLGVRLAFLGLGALLPWLVYRFAARFETRTDALLAAGATACLPLAGTLGLLAVPDVPLAVLAVAGLVAACRAVESGAIRWWVLAGVFAALGLCTHYRFAVWLAGPALWLLFTRDGRAQLRSPGPWLAGLVVLAGLAPLAWFNLRHDMAGFAFQFVERHPWAWQPEGWRFLLTQMTVATPLVFAALASAAWLGWRRGRERPAARLALWFSLVPFVGFALAAFFADVERTTAHWPLAAYLPLLAWVPAALRAWPAWLRRLTPLTGLVGTAVLLGWLAIAAWPESLGGVVGGKAFPHNLTGWREAARQVQTRRETLVSAPGVLVAGNFMLAAELSFELGGQRVYSLDHERNARHGRALQLRIWGLDETALMEDQADQPAQVVIEDTALTIADQPGWTRRLCTRFRDLAYLGEQVLHGGRTRFLHFAGRVRSEPASPPAAPIPTAECDLPPFAYLARPLDGDTVRHPMEVLGWTVEDNAGAAGVSLLLDGEPLAELDYGWEWDDVARFLPGSVDPNHPRVGFNEEVSLEGVATGWRELSLRVRTEDGNERVVEQRQVRVVQ